MHTQLLMGVNHREGFSFQLCAGTAKIYTGSDVPQLALAWVVSPPRQEAVKKMPNHLHDQRLDSTWRGECTSRTSLPSQKRPGLTLLSLSLLKQITVLMNSACCLIQLNKYYCQWGYLQSLGCQHCVYMLALQIVSRWICAESYLWDRITLPGIQMPNSEVFLLAFSGLPCPY